ncbi:M23 family metallopeptidase [Bacillota bacterium]
MMRIDGNSAYDKSGDERRKWNYRYTMVAIIAVLLIVAATMLVWDKGIDPIARNDNNGNINNSNDRNFLIGDGDLDVVQPLPTVDSRDTPSPIPNTGQNESGGMKNPVAGGVIAKGYSGNELIYSKTLDQYVVHSGIDIEAPLDAPVTAVKGGTVTKVYNDDKLGITIEISHGSGFVTRYSNLSTDRMVEEGDVVETGDTISGVGITALFESSDSPHLHFEVLQDGISIDPVKYAKAE